MLNPFAPQGPLYGLRIGVLVGGGIDIHQGLDLPLFETFFKGQGLDIFFLELGYDPGHIDPGVQGLLVHEKLFLIQDEDKGGYVLEQGKGRLIGGIHCLFDIGMVSIVHAGSVEQQGQVSAELIKF